MQLVEVHCGQEAEVAALADEIWHEHYKTILKKEQIDYMVDKYQSVPAITGQLEKGYRYFLVEIDKEYAGYIGLVFPPENGRLFLSKLYVAKKFRGKGVASLMFQKALSLAKEVQADIIWLTVNRGNTDSVSVYRHWGFETVRTEDTKIGNGFEMNDYIMEYQVAKLPV